MDQIMRKKESILTILNTERLTIRRFKPEDWQDLHAYLSLEDVIRYEPYGVFTEEESKREAASRSENPAFWAVCLKDTGTLIGNLYFQQQEPKQFETWELGYVFHSGYQGFGYATEASRELMKLGFNEFKARRMIAHCNPLNSRSWRLLERLKFRREGHALQTVYFKCDEAGNPLWHDTYSYGMLRDEWELISHS
ncbi:GNAT family N-acetyltransferase [Paenibacillus stellifer]|uniref:GNAT family N-acetyltransferase n=1 Tax=Paenibacillus stellifer TaxID=169760 RepID=UPI001FE0A4ED|nr:GNAT family N-acetyltransferase [Paenibacillus stellifer]